MSAQVGDENVTSEFCQNYFSETVQYCSHEPTHRLDRADTEGSIIVEKGAVIVGAVIIGSSTEQCFEVWIVIRVKRRL